MISVRNLAFVISGLVAGAFGAAPAPAAVSVAWQGRYEADAMPGSSTPAWFSDGSYATDVSVSGGILSQNTTFSGYAYFRMDPPNYDASTVSGSTIEIRARATTLEGSATQTTRMTFG